MDIENVYKELWISYPWIWKSEEKNRYLQPYVNEEYIVMQYLKYSKQNFED